MPKKYSPKRGRPVPKMVLRLPGLDQGKSAVLSRLTSKDAQLGYRHAIDEFVEWYCPEPRLSFNGENLFMCSPGMERLPVKMLAFRHSTLLRSPLRREHLPSNAMIHFKMVGKRWRQRRSDVLRRRDRQLPGRRQPARHVHNALYLTNN